MSAQRSIVIGGGAFAGLALALALRQGLGADIPVIVADPALARGRAAIRARPPSSPPAGGCSRPSGSGTRSLPRRSRSSTWSSPIPNWKTRTRPVFLTFAGDVEPGEPFAHMIENRHLIDALVRRAEAEGIDLRATAVTTFDVAGPTAST